jgi:hypothetical protein
MRRLSGVLVALALLSVATPALAERPASSTEKQAITKAIKRSLKQQGSPAASTVRVSGVRISTQDGAWAIASVHAKNADDASVALQRRHGAWKVRNVGTAQVQCAIGMPKAVQQELFGSTNCSG